MKNLYKNSLVLSVFIISSVICLCFFGGKQLDNSNIVAGTKEDETPTEKESYVETLSYNNIAWNENKQKLKEEESFNQNEKEITVAGQVANEMEKAAVEQELQQENIKESGVLEEEPKEITIVAVGDNLIHTQVIRSGKQTDGTYNFSHLFSGVKDEIESADVAIINQETILCDESLGYSGYPTFGSPYAIGEAIYEAGFDVVLHATNHTMDKGVAGITDSIDFWNQYEEIAVVGVNESEESSRIAYVEKEGITIAILNYTYGLNGLSLPKGKEYMVNLLSDEEQMKKDIELAKESSDFVIVCPHWGTEYVYKPTNEQKRLTKFFAEEGVDLVIGTHPHVLEPVEWVSNEAGTHQMLVYYSLGNFVSNQDRMARMLGGMAQIKLIVDEDGEVIIEDAEIEPVVTHTFYDGKQRFTTYLLKDYNIELATKHNLNQKKKNEITLSRLQSLSTEILGDWYSIAG